MSSLPGQRSATATECAGLQPRQLVAATRAAAQDQELVATNAHPRAWGRRRNGPNRFPTAPTPKVCRRERCTDHPSNCTENHAGEGREVYVADRVQVRCGDVCLIHIHTLDKQQGRQDRQPRGASPARQSELDRYTDIGTGRLRSFNSKRNGVSAVCMRRFEEDSTRDNIGAADRRLCATLGSSRFTNLGACRTRRRRASLCKEKSVRLQSSLGVSGVRKAVFIGRTVKQEQVEVNV